MLPDFTKSSLASINCQVSPLRRRWTASSTGSRTSVAQPGGDECQLSQPQGGSDGVWSGLAVIDAWLGEKQLY